MLPSSLIFGLRFFNGNFVFFKKIFEKQFAEYLQLLLSISSINQITICYKPFFEKRLNDLTAFTPR